MKDGCSPPISLETKPQRKLHHGYKVFVSTWNVGGALPDADLRLDNWLDTRELYDVYVLGFQEAVPLTPLTSSAPQPILSRWNYLISAALNRSSSSSSSSSTSSSSSSSGQKIHPVKEGQAEEFFCVASKQMVGILLIVWLRGSLRKDLRHLSISAVGCGAMGFMGNKGAISVSFFLQKKSFCFVCCHLSSGGAAGDEQRRNRDAAKILSRTAFLRRRPRKILDHDRIILLGDLNYRVSLPVPTARSLVAKKEWAMLLQRDQLLAEMSGGILEGWSEGAIRFPPTYKYNPNSDEYYGCVPGSKGDNTRAPAWCDRILWRGKGLTQTRYDRYESKLSDHRPVRAVFVIPVHTDTWRTMPCGSQMRRQTLLSLISSSPSDHNQIRQSEGSVSSVTVYPSPFSNVEL